MLLVRNGFIKPQYKHLYKLDEKTGKYVIADPEKYGKPKEEHADEEEAEEVNISNTPKLFKTGYPKPLKRYRIVLESFNLSMEETYYWFLGHLRQDMAFPKIHKITDIFSAAENSAFFGQSAQRLSIQEDRAGNFLRVIAQLVKELFQIIRELRIIDERLSIYDAWDKIPRSKSADVTLKGIFADFAENKGGQMQPGSIYHLSQTVGYSSLPDLFFNTHVYKKEDIDKVVDSMTSFNKNVRNVLKRKLYQFLVWKEKTHHELKNRKRFQLRYLRQHWAIIKMYMAWTKPYLRHIKRLTMNEKQLDSPDLISAFETSMTEIEILAVKPHKGGYNSCILATFQFNTRPIMQYRQEYQQGPVHVGRVTATLRAYGWTDQDIENYKKLKTDEEKDLLFLVDDSVSAAMEELSEDLEKYLNEAGKDIFDREIHEKYGHKDAPPKKVSPKKLPAPPVWEPFMALFGGFWDIFTSFIPVPRKKAKPTGPDHSQKKAAAKGAAGAMWQAYKNYKKSHGLLSW